MRTLAVALLTLGDPGRLTGGYLYHLRMAELAPHFDARLEFIPLPDRPFPLSTLHGARALAAARRARADAVVLDSIAAAFVAPWLARRRSHPPVIGMLHQPPGGIDHGPLRTRIQVVMDRLAYRHLRLLVAASDSLKKELVAGGVPPHLVVVVPPGRDVATMVEPASDLRRGRHAAVLCVGNWLERKGIRELLEAFARLPGEAATLHLVGDDRADPRYARRLRARLARPDLAGRIVVHGAVSREVVAGLYQAADLFVLPSFKEPFGTVYGEAMAFGLPVVGWRAGNLPYLVDDGREGLLLPPGDVAGLSRAMARLAGDERMRREMGAAAARRAATRPTWEESAARFFGAIRELLWADGKTGTPGL